jgi:hypothetical protein
MLRMITLLLGIIFIFVGVAGFLPNFMMNDLLFGYFTVNPMHNAVHLVSGIVGIMAATRYNWSKLFLQVFGVVYTLVACAGFWRGGDLWMMQMNTADNILHLVVGVVALYLGFSAKNKHY